MTVHFLPTKSTVRELVIARFPTMIAIIVRDYNFPLLNMKAVINEFRETRELILEWVIGTVNVSPHIVKHMLLISRFI